MFEKRDLSKRWGEQFFFYYGGIWILYMILVIAFQAYENPQSPAKWFWIGLLPAIPCWIYPLVFPGDFDKNIPLFDRYWFKVNVWIAIFGFVGNYFWTHYFFTLLGAKYTLTTYELNGIPLIMYFLTHAYFSLYFVGGNMIQRLFYHLYPHKGMLRNISYIVMLCSISYIIAFAETWTISVFPYYTFTDRGMMYKIGSIFYGLCFVAGFPLFYRMDAEGQLKWTIDRVIIESLAASMIVTCLFDFWRLILGAIHVTGLSNSIPFIPQ